jgi:hypothetical protein
VAARRPAIVDHAIERAGALRRYDEIRLAR